jgi:hypothetical protein
MKYWKQEVLERARPTFRIHGKTRPSKIAELWLPLPDGTAVWIMQ